MKIRRGSLMWPLSFVALTACSDDGGVVDPSENGSPVAVISAEPTRVPAGDNNQTVVTLDAAGSFDPDGDALSYEWTAQSGTFVDGTSATDQVAKVTFPGAAPYRVTLVVRDGRGGSDSAETTIGLGQP